MKGSTQVLRRAVFLISLLLALALYFFVFRNLYYSPTALERSGARNNWMQRGFSVAIVWPPHAEPSLFQGVTLALEEVNAGGGRLAGKIRLRLLTETDDRGALALDIVKDREVLAVIGYELGGNAIPASLAYETHGVLLLSAKSSDIRLTDHQFQYVFRLSLDDRSYARALASFALEQKWPHVGVLFGRTDHGESASAQFLVAASQMNVTVPLAESFFHDPDWRLQDFRPMLAGVRAKQFDALFLADELPWAAKLLGDMATMGVTQPVLATNKLDSSDVWSLTQGAANNVYVASSVDPESTIPAYLSFRERFRRRFNAEPSYGASQGYEAFMIFVNACLLSNSADPLVVATTLRTNKWNGLFGEVSFTPAGDVVGRVVSIKHMQNGTFHTVAVEKDVE
jgi:ABC-type branched-subunit amino acid transport system substrate-binding protein